MSTQEKPPREWGLIGEGPYLNPIVAIGPSLEKGVVCRAVDVKAYESLRQKLELGEKVIRDTLQNAKELGELNAEEISKLRRERDELAAKLKGGEGKA